MTAMIRSSTLRQLATKNFFYEGPAGQTHHWRLSHWAGVHPPAALCSVTTLLYALSPTPCPNSPCPHAHPNPLGACTLGRESIVQQGQRSLFLRCISLRSSDSGTPGTRGCRALGKHQDLHPHPFYKPQKQMLRKLTFKPG